MIDVPRRFQYPGATSAEDPAEELGDGAVRVSLVRLNKKLTELVRRVDRLESHHEHSYANLERNVRKTFEEFIGVIQRLHPETSDEQDPQPDPRPARKQVYLLREDMAMNLRSRPEVVGFAVTSKEEAERWVKEGYKGFFPAFGAHETDKTYEAITVVDRLEDLRETPRATKAKKHWG